MKKKLVTIVLLSLMIALVIFGSVGNALAEEITLSLMSYQSEEISQEEIDFALYNLQYKLEVEELPRLIRVEEVYDFNEEPLYCLYELDGYYMIVIRNTGSVLERGEGNSAYYGNNNVKYYGGYQEYYVLQDGGYKNVLTGDIASKSRISQMQLRMSELRELDYQDYLEAMSTPMTYGSSNRNNITKLGKNIKDLIDFAYGNENYLFDYFAEEINIDFQLTNNNSNIYREDHSFKVNDEYYGTVYSRYFDDYFYGCDLLYPKNYDNECSLVTMTMLLQYYYRTGINESLLDPFYDHPYHSDIEIQFYPLKSLAETVKSDLKTYLNTIVPSTNAATYVNMDAAFDRYFKANGINCESIHFTSYTNVKAAIDGGHPSIFNTGAGTGYSYDKEEDGNKRSIDVSWHNLIAYGYTTNSSGVLDEFLCHAGWHKTITDTYSNPNGAECAKLFVNKFAAIGNLHLSY